MFDGTQLIFVGGTSLQFGKTLSARSFAKKRGGFGRWVAAFENQWLHFNFCYCVGRQMLLLCPHRYLENDDAEHLRRSRLQCRSRWVRKARQWKNTPKKSPLRKRTPPSWNTNARTMVASLAVWNGSTGSAPPVFASSFTSPSVAK